MIKSSHQAKNDLLHFHGPRWNEIPAIPLYMDQVVSFINMGLANLSLDTNSSFITKSMVNNYVKNSMIKPPIKKQYKTYHLGFLIVVCLLKQCYSLSMISQLIHIYYEMNDDRIQSHYDTFISIFETYLKEIMKTGTIQSRPLIDPSIPQHIMDTVIKTVVYKIYSDYLLIVYQNEKQAD